MAKGRGCISGIFTNIFLAALILGLYYAVQPGNIAEAVPVAAPVYRGRGDGVALQFSVSWNAAALSDIIDILEGYGVSSTFAVSGEWAEKNPELLRNIADHGHELATMGYYPHMDGILSWQIQDINKSLTAIETICGQRPELYYSAGRQGIMSALTAEKLGLVQVECTIDLLCAKGGSRDILARIPDDLDEGSIMLLQPTAECADALEGILAALEEKGLRATCTGDVLA